MNVRGRDLCTGYMFGAGFYVRTVNCARVSHQVDDPQVCFCLLFVVGRVCGGCDGLKPVVDVVGQGDTSLPALLLHCFKEQNFGDFGKQTSVFI